MIEFLIIALLSGLIFRTGSRVEELVDGGRFLEVVQEV
jgi:hypothetical protein